MTGILDYLRRVEQETAAAVSLGRRLMAAPHPSRPIDDMQVCELGCGHIGLDIHVSQNGAVGDVAAWASVLGDVPVDMKPVASAPVGVEHSVAGELDGVPVEAWTVVFVPIDRAVVVAGRGAWTVRYRQGGVHRAVSMRSRAEADQWIASYGPKAVTA